MKHFIYVASIFTLLGGLSIFLSLVEILGRPIVTFESEGERHSVVYDSLWPHGILQARTLEWVAYPFSRGSSQPRDRTQVSCIAGGFFTNWAIKEANNNLQNLNNNMNPVIPSRHKNAVISTTKMFSAVWLLMSQLSSAAVLLPVWAWAAPPALTWAGMRMAEVRDGRALLGWHRHRLWGSSVLVHSAALVLSLGQLLKDPAAGTFTRDADNAWLPLDSSLEPWATIWQSVSFAVLK